MRAALACGALLALAACTAPAGDPIAWWRQLEGGRLAQDRPPPPNPDAPFPNLATVPARPATTGATTRAGIAAGLANDQRDGAFATTRPIASPSLRPAAAPQPAPPGGIGASLAAASAPPASAPSPPVQAARPAIAPPQTPPPVQTTLTLPSAPPAPPHLPGVAGITAPAPPPRAPAPPPPAPAPFIPGAPVGIAFPAGSAVLPEGAPATLRQLAATRAGRPIRVVGYGESLAIDAASQAATLGLGFARARAIATVLAQAGVPAEAILLTGEAIGRGGVARIAE